MVTPMTSQHVRLRSVLSFLLLVGAACRVDDKTGDPVEMSSGDASTTDEEPTGGADSGDPAAAIAEICAAGSACDCESPTYASVEACVAGWEMEEAVLAGVAAELGLQYEPGCLAVTAKIYGLAGCEGGYPELPRGCAWRCKSVYGSQGIGESCNEYDEGDDCAQGLECSFEARCIPACDGQEGDGCEYPEQCADGLYCRYGDTAVCAKPVVAGAACVYETDLCADGHYCHETDEVCAAYAGSGAACDEASECAPGLYCDLDVLRCAAEPEAGDVCGDRLECVDEAYCVIGFDGVEDMCKAFTPVGAACEDDSPWCVEGSDCVDNVCTAWQPFACQ